MVINNAEQLCNLNRYCRNKHTTQNPPGIRTCMPKSKVCCCTKAHTPLCVSESGLKSKSLAGDHVTRNITTPKSEEEEEEE
jgi:hypothetical protein